MYYIIVYFNSILLYTRLVLKENSKTLKAIKLCTTGAGEIA